MGLAKQDATAAAKRETHQRPDLPQTCRRGLCPRRVNRLGTAVPSRVLFVVVPTPSPSIGVRRVSRMSRTASDVGTYLVAAREIPATKRMPFPKSHPLPPCVYW